MDEHREGPTGYNHPRPVEVTVAQSAADSSVLRFGVFELNARTGELRKAGTLVKLQPQPLRVLALLAGRSGELVTREELQQQIWGNDTFVDFEQGLNYCIKQIRLALGDDSETPRYVETLPRRGYRFVAPVERVAGTPAATQTLPSPSPAPTMPARSRGVKVAVGIGLAVVLLVVLGALLREKFRPAAPEPGRVMLVVLPFDNLSDDPEQEYFSDGLTDEMITELAGLQPQRLGVIARTSAMRYKRTEETAGEIGRELGVDYILEGAVRREGPRVRITTQLIQVKDQTHLWAESYEREIASVFEIQKEVAGRVARSLALELLPEQRMALAHPRSTTPEAYEAYLKGRYFSMRGSSRKAADYFRQAIAADASYAPAYAGLANLMVFWAPAAQYMPMARDAARKALELDPRSADAHSAMGLVKLMYEWNWADAETEFQEALQLDPSNAANHLRYSNYLAAMGKLEEAIREARRAQQLDPLFLITIQNIGRYYSMLGETDKAIAEYKKALELDPNFSWSFLFLSFAYETKGEYDQWLACQKRAWVLMRNRSDIGDEMEQAYRKGGYPAAMRRLNQMYEKDARNSEMTSATLAINSIKLGDKDKALYWLEKAYENHTRDLIYLNVMPEYDPVRSDPRFQEIVRKIGLPAGRMAGLPAVETGKR